MRPRSLVAPLAVVATLAATLLAAGQPAASPAPARAPVRAVDDQPNIVLILTDDMRADELRFMPQVKRLLVRAGVSYTRAISPHPVCCPARAELITGQLGQNNGVRNNQGPWGGYQALNDPDNTIAGWIRATGYATSYHGKYLNGYELAASPVEPGWTRWDAQVGGTYSYDKRARFVDGDVIDGRYITHIIGRRTDRTMARFSRRGKPFFTIINHIAPHGSHWRGEGKWDYPVFEEKHRELYPHLKPPAYDDPSFQERDVSDLPADLRQPATRTEGLVRLARNRARALRSVDDAVARTIGQLRDLGELANTYVVFASDNGYQIGEHRLRGKNLPFDESFDIPLVIRGPGIEPGSVIDEPVTLVDLAATFLDWAGGVLPGREPDGLSLRQVGDEHPRDTLLVQIGDSTDDTTDGWRYRGVTTDRYLFAIHAGDPGTGILFDRELDPHATVNRFHDPAYAEIQRELLARTRELATCAGVEGCNREFGTLPDPG